METYDSLLILSGGSATSSWARGSRPRPLQPVVVVRLQEGAASARALSGLPSSREAVFTSPGSIGAPRRWAVPSPPTGRALVLTLDIPSPHGPLQVRLIRRTPGSRRILQDSPDVATTLICCSLSQHLHLSCVIGTVGEDLPRSLEQRAPKSSDWSEVTPRPRSR